MRVLHTSGHLAGFRLRNVSRDRLQTLSCIEVFVQPKIEFQWSPNQDERDIVLPLNCLCKISQCVRHLQRQTRQKAVSLDCLQTCERVLRPSMDIGRVSVTQHVCKYALGFMQSCINRYVKVKSLYYSPIFAQYNYSVFIIY